VLTAISKLDPAAREVLSEEVSDLGDRLWNKLLTRLAPIAGVAPPPPPAPRPVKEQGQASTGRAAGEFRQGSSVMKTSGSQTLRRSSSSGSGSQTQTRIGSVRELDGTLRPDLVPPPPPPKAAASGKGSAAVQEEVLVAK